MERTSRRSVRWILPILVLALIVADPALANSGQEPEPGFSYGFEAKGSWRDSDPAVFPVGLPPALRQEDGAVALPLATVDPEDHLELANVALWFRASWGRYWEAKAKVDVVDLHDRNPTGSDDEVSLDELWIRWGQETATAEQAEGYGAYVLLGKIPKFERQDDRHLESYGLLSTAFNRFEDIGVEFGFDLGRHFYVKGSFTQGNPLFLRDPNALAGDNGVGLANGDRDPNPEFASGIPIFYDADVDEIDFDNPEIGVALGMRLGSVRDGLGAEVMLWGYDRDLADTVDLSNTIYGGDLDLLDGPDFGPLGTFPLAITNDGKREIGANLWFYWGNFTLFGQYVNQDLAGLDRKGYEIEVSYAFGLPYLGSVGGRPLFSYIAPAIRYSELDPEFPVANGFFPAISAVWDWEKIDLGLRLGLIDGLLDLTVEWNLNDFVRAGVTEEADEFLATVRWQMSRGSNR